MNNIPNFIAKTNKLKQCLIETINCDKIVELNKIAELCDKKTGINGKVIGIKPSQNALTVSPNSDIQVSFNKSILGLPKDEGECLCG